MALRPIRLYPDPVLREPAREVELFDADLRALAADMIETMHAAPGVGLAAPQVGVSLRLCVIDISGGEDPAAVRILANPEILFEEGSELAEEGCLSIPAFTERLERPLAVRISAQDLEGRPIEIEGKGLLARALRHEVDHLEGVLFVDRLRGLRRERAKRALRRMVEERGG